jgi:alkylated DNA repair dioxygenase AlkB
MDEALPPGAGYCRDFMSQDEAAELLLHVRALDFEPVRMRGQPARRRTVHFGWIYGYTSWRIGPGPPIPDSLVPVRARAATWAGVTPERLAEALVTEYVRGAGIGWHRDAPQFGAVIGVSLAGACRLRFQRGTGPSRRTSTLMLEPSSAYLLDGEARWQWQHSIPPVKEARYSITFRTLRR